MGLSKLDMLFIRACKSLKSQQRVESVYRRFYYRRASESERKKALICILAKICDKYCRLSLVDTLYLLHPNRLIMMQKKPPCYEDRALTMLVSRIRLSKTEAFPGLVPPVYFRNKR